MEIEYGNERNQGTALQRTYSRSFHDVAAAFEAAIGHPEMNAFGKNLVAAKTFAEVEKIVRAATGPTAARPSKNATDEAASS
jgi:hypothetical protein